MLLTVVATTVKATVVNSPERTHEPPFQDQRAAAVVCTQIIRQPPTEESEALVGRRIMRKWEGFAFGWCAPLCGRDHQCGLCARSTRPRSTSSRATTWTRRRRSPFLTCSSSINTRRPTEDAEYNSWLLLEKVELEGEQGGEEGEEEAGVQAMQLS